MDKFSKYLVKGFKSYSYPKYFRLQIINVQSFSAQMAAFLEYSQATLNKQNNSLNLNLVVHYNTCTRL